jgi:hypothetical protein
VALRQAASTPTLPSVGFQARSPIGKHEIDRSGDCSAEKQAVSSRPLCLLYGDLSIVLSLNEFHAKVAL